MQQFKFIFPKNNLQSVTPKVIKMWPCFTIVVLFLLRLSEFGHCATSTSPVFKNQLQVATPNFQTSSLAFSAIEAQADNYSTSTFAGDKDSQGVNYPGRSTVPPSWKYSSPGFEPRGDVGGVGGGGGYGSGGFGGNAGWGGGGAGGFDTSEAVAPIIYNYKLYQNPGSGGWSPPVKYVEDDDDDFDFDKGLLGLLGLFGLKGLKGLKGLLSLLLILKKLGLIPLLPFKLPLLLLKLPLLLLLLLFIPVPVISAGRYLTDSVWPSRNVYDYIQDTMENVLNAISTPIFDMSHFTETTRGKNSRNSLSLSKEDIVKIQSELPQNSTPTTASNFIADKSPQKITNGTVTNLKKRPAKIFSTWLPKSEKI